MTPLDDEFIKEEARQCALDVKDNISKLIRAFSDREMALKLQQYQTKSSEFSAFVDSFQNMQRLYTVKLNTPQEEVKSIKANLSLLKEKISKLEHLRGQKKDAYDQYCEECSKSKEIRDNQIKILKEQVTYENSQRETSIENAKEQGMADEKALNENHESTMAELIKKKEIAEKQHAEQLNKNTKDEERLRKEFKKASSAYRENMNQYDMELKNGTKENENTKQEYDSTVEDLNGMKAEYNILLEEKRKREEIAAIMQRKKDEQNAKMDKLIKATEYIQAHWRGMQERKIMEKTRKKKKGKKGKKK